MSEQKEIYLGPVHVVAGDVVTRNLCGMEMDLLVSDVKDGIIYCGPWMFDQKTGGEIDDQIPDIREGMLISFIKRKDN